MSDPKDPNPPKTPDAPAISEPGAPKSSGRVAFDARGNPIWEWQLETGVYSRDVSTQRLKKLDLGDLSIAETAPHKRPEGLGDTPTSRTKPPLPGGGFNPYDSGSKGSGSNPYDNASSRGKELAAEPERKPTDLRKLEAWMKMKKDLEKKKKDLEKKKKD